MSPIRERYDDVAIKNKDVVELYDPEMRRKRRTIVPPHGVESEPLRSASWMSLKFTINS